MRSILDNIVELNRVNTWTGEIHCNVDWTWRNNYADSLWLIEVLLMNFNDITVPSHESPGLLCALSHNKTIKHSTSFNYTPLASGFIAFPLLQKWFKNVSFLKCTLVVLFGNHRFNNSFSLKSSLKWIMLIFWQDDLPDSMDHLSIWEGHNNTGQGCFSENQRWPAPDLIKLNKSCWPKTT